MFFERHYRPTEEIIPAGFVDIDDVVERFERDPRHRSAMEAARRELTERLPAIKQRTITSLRLRRGWSQKRLAAEIGTNQSHVARMEAGTEDLRLSTIDGLASVLEVPVHEIVDGLRGERRRK